MDHGIAGLDGFLKEIINTMNDVCLLRVTMNGIIMHPRKVLVSLFIWSTCALNDVAFESHYFKIYRHSSSFFMSMSAKDTMGDPTYHKGSTQKIMNTSNNEPLHGR